MKARKENSEIPDEVLVIAATLGDMRAFDELALRYRSAVYRVAQGIVGKEAAEDVAQDALLLAFKALPSLEEPSSFAPWLYAITRHRAFRYSKKERSRSDREVELDQLILQESEALKCPMDIAEADDRLDEVRQALDQLPADYSLILKLRFYDEMSLKRIADFLSLPLSTVKWRLHKGKEMLREKVRHCRAIKTNVSE